MPDDRARAADGLGVLVVVEFEAAVREQPVASTCSELLGQLEVPGLARLAVKLDERDLHLGVPVCPLVGAHAEDLVDQIGKPAGDGQETRVPRRPG